jgi:hypothetical protein
MRKPNLNPNILIALRGCGAYSMPQETLTSTLIITVKPPPSTEDIQNAMQDLQSKHAVVKISDGLTDEVKWKITDEGNALLMAAGL